MPTHTGDLSSDILNAALAGLEAQKQRIEREIEQVRSMLGAGAEVAAPSSPARKRRQMSAATRARMSEAQRKRYAATKKVNPPPAKAVTKKRKLSAAGRKRIIAATKKRWAEYKAKKAAS